MYFVYILKSINFPKTYVGITDNLERRIEQHNLGLHSYTKKYLPWVFIHQEPLKTRIEARTREKYLKSSAGRKWIRYNIFNTIA